MKLIFGSSVHKNFDVFLDLYKGVRKFYGDPVYIFASNQGLGQSSGNLIKIESRRNYKWRRSHNFIFDAAEALKNYDYDYFVALDSDCLVCGGALIDFLKDENFDFVIYHNLNGEGNWYHGNMFKANIGSYLDILKTLDIKRKDEDIVGNFNPLIVRSKKVMDFLRNNIARIEASKGYKELMDLDFSIGETLVPNILKDAGYKFKYISAEIKRGIRYRPYWEVGEFQGNIPIYHPVKIKKNDLFRRFIGIKCGYDKNYIFLPVIHITRLYSKVRGIFFKKEKLPGEGETWFNA